MSEKLDEKALEAAVAEVGGVEDHGTPIETVLPRDLTTRIASAAVTAYLRAKGCGLLAVDVASERACLKDYAETMLGLATSGSAFDEGYRTAANSLLSAIVAREKLDAKLAKVSPSAMLAAAGGKDG